MLADHPVAIYANRFVAVFGGREVERVLDLEAWAGTPTAPGQLPLAWVSGYEDALLVVTNPRAATARTTSYMARLDPVRERVLWRTEAVLQSRAPLLFEAYAVTLAGPPGDVAVVTVRLADGKVGTTLAPGVDGPDFGWDPRGFVYVGLPTARRWHPARSSLRVSAMTAPTRTFTIITRTPRRSFAPAATGASSMCR